MYRTHAPRVFRYFLWRVGDRTIAEDLTADVFVRLLETAGRYEDRGAPPAAWLYKIAHDRLVDHYRRQARRPVSPLSEAVEDPEPGPEPRIALALAHHDLINQASQLSEVQKQVIQLRFIEGRSVMETAEIMRKTLGAVKALQYRAVRSLAHQLGR